ncbi:TPA: hypothetical protein ACN1NE_002954 [Enterococcus faecalis]
MLASNLPSLLLGILLLFGWSNALNFPSNKYLWGW